VAFTFIAVSATVSFGEGIVASLSIIPRNDSITVAPGKEYDGQFQVKNEGETEVSLQIVLKDFSLTETGGLSLEDIGLIKDHALAEYIDYTPEELSLQPGDTGQVSYRINLPEGLQGLHWAAFVIRPQETTQQTVETPSEEGFLFKVNVQVQYVFQLIQYPVNPPTPEGRVLTIQVSGAKGGNGEKSLTVSTTFENTSQTVLRCQVYMEVRDSTGDRILRYDLPENQLVLPETQRIFSHTFQDVDMGPGQYLILAVIDYGGEHLVAGQYKATIAETE
jgi:hypothetical protein